MARKNKADAAPGEGKTTPVEIYKVGGDEVAHWPDELEEKIFIVLFESWMRFSGRANPIGFVDINGGVIEALSEQAATIAVHRRTHLERIAKLKEPTEKPNAENT